MSEPTTLMIVGASVRAAAQSAVRAGFRVLAADLFADRDLREIADCRRVTNYPAEFLQLRAQCPATPVVYTGALENHPELLDEFERRGPLWGNGGVVVKRVRNPETLQRALSRHGIPAPAVRRLSPTSDEEGEWLAKPLRSAGGAGIHVWDGRAKASPGNADEAKIYFQRRLHGRPCSAAFVAADGNCRLLGVSTMLVGEAWAGAAAWRYCGSYQRPVDESEQKRWRDIGQALSAEFSLTGLFGVDAIARDGEVWPIEVNPRYTASMELWDRSSPTSLMALHVAACRTGLPPASVLPPTHLGPFIGKVVCYAPRDLWLAGDFLKRAAFAARDVELADLPAQAGCVRRGSPILTLIGRGDDALHLLDVLRAAARAIWACASTA